MAVYEWREWRDGDDRFFGLLPVEESNNCALSRIAFIYRTSRGMFVGSYYFPHSTGNADGRGSVYLKTVKGCKRWVERELQKFWEPPEIIV